MHLTNIDDIKQVITSSIIDVIKLDDDTLMKLTNNIFINVKSYLESNIDNLIINDEAIELSQVNKSLTEINQSLTETNDILVKEEKVKEIKQELLLFLLPVQLQLRNICRPTDKI